MPAPDLFQNLSSYLAMPEKECVKRLVDSLDWDGGRSNRVSDSAAKTITAMREAKRKPGSIESFFQTYGLNTKEGLALMCLAEALLRVPDAGTANALIDDKISGTQWGGEEPLTPEWILREAGVHDETPPQKDWMLRLAEMGLSVSRATLEGPLSRMGAPVIRTALHAGMKILGGQFVLGQSIHQAMNNAEKMEEESGYWFSYDMLGEGARTMEDADAYYKSYERAIDNIAERKGGHEGLQAGISVKLSALYPRYSFAQEAYCVPVLIQKLATLCRRAVAANICLTVDAEEVDRLETSLKIVAAILDDITLAPWEGFGLAVQAYGKRCLPLIDGLIAAARQSGRKLQIRLVKGAYWDTEIKRAQVKGLKDYPVFTRKIHTDLSYMVCAQKLLQAREWVYPMFGTHNAYTVQAIIDMAGEDKSGFEFQRLFGMGEALYERVREIEKLPVRIYAPVGVHRDLLPYLVRRMLENGANSSFVNKVFDPEISAQALSRDPVEDVLEKGGFPHPAIPLPKMIFQDRFNSTGIDLDDAPTLQTALADIERAFTRREMDCGPIIGGRGVKNGSSFEIYNPADKRERIGTAYCANHEITEQAFREACKAAKDWKAVRAAERADILRKIADLYETNAELLMALCIREAGKTVGDALAEVREAVDFCRYYAATGEADFDENGRNLSSYTGESNKILLQGRGVFACISPWNFPLAIFTGQIVAALMAGNAVVAKPAEQTPFVAHAAVKFMHQAGVPGNVLQLLIGDGKIGEMMVQHALVAGVAFTGSTDAAWAINRALAAKDGPIVPFIAETGGQNAIIADSSSLPEQVVDDVILSAFGSGGQRCSACRVLFVQDDVAEKVIAMLRGAMGELKIGNPQFYETDIGPLIDDEALAVLQKHKSALDGFGKFIAEAPLSDEIKQSGHYFAPIAYEIGGLSDLKREVFGPALHVIRYKASELPDVIKSINESGFGLTFGFHTRIDKVAAKAIQDVDAGNIYINRSIIGAVVGVQPFGGQGLSGTGPKAGGPFYLHRFAVEKTVSVNTTAAGGNASLVMLEE